MSEVYKILAIDDEPNNLRLLKLDLEDGNYDVLTAEDGLRGWEILQQNKEEVKVILLDRMMPNMDGMEFMAKLKSDEEVSNIPVVMQTAAAEREQVVQGIQSGVYYYLTKPYEKDVMLSIVKAAVEDYAEYSKIRKELRLFKSKVHLVRNSSFEVQTVDDAKYLSTFLANFFPDPEQVVLGISELIINGIEHGNLGVTYSEKGELNNSGKWLEEIDRRLKLPENKDKKVFVDYEKTESEIILRIKDEGDGFDCNDFLEISPERATHNHGRGIALSKMMSFDKLEYIGSGNEVVCRVAVPKQGD